MFIYMFIYIYIYVCVENFTREDGVLQECQI